MLLLYIIRDCIIGHWPELIGLLYVLQQRARIVSQFFSETQFVLGLSYKFCYTALPAGPDLGGGPEGPGPRPPTNRGPPTKPLNF